MPPTSIVVRRASDDDHELIIELHARSQLATYGGLLDDDARRRIPVSVREFWTDWRSAPAREGLLLVASCGKTLAGFALCESTTHGMMLRSLHVDDVFRGRGIGSVLLEEIPNWCSKRGVLGLVLHVVRRNMAPGRFMRPMAGASCRDRCRTRLAAGPSRWCVTSGCLRANARPA